MWYKRLRDFFKIKVLKSVRFVHVYFIKQIYTWLVIVAIIVDNFSLIGMIGAIAHIDFISSGEFEMKYRRETTFLSWSIG